MMSATNDSVVQVQYDAFESRLVVQLKIFISLEIILVVLITISIVLVFIFKPPQLASKDPTTMLGLASVIAKKP